MPTQKEIRLFLQKQNQVNQSFTSKLFVAFFSTPVGEMLAVADEEALLLLEFFSRKNLAKELVQTAEKCRGQFVFVDNVVTQQAVKEMQEYFAGKRSSFSVPMKTFGTSFQEKVWQALRKIPYGQRISYQMLAEDVGQPTASRAVANANGKNQIAIMIPCHRVVQKSGALGGYGGGLDKKEKLLGMETQRS